MSGARRKTLNKFLCAFVFAGAWDKEISRGKAEQGKESN